MQKLKCTFCKLCIRNYITSSPVLFFYMETAYLHNSTSSLSSFVFFYSLCNVVPKLSQYMKWISNFVPSVILSSLVPRAFVAFWCEEDANKTKQTCWRLPYNKNPQMFLERECILSLDNISWACSKEHSIKLVKKLCCSKGKGQKK